MSRIGAQGAKLDIMCALCFSIGSNLRRQSSQDLCGKILTLILLMTLTSSLVSCCFVTSNISVHRKSGTFATFFCSHRKNLNIRSDIQLRKVIGFKIAALFACLKGYFSRTPATIQIERVLNER